MMQEGLQQNFHLKPARIYFQANEQVDSMVSLKQANGYFRFYHKNLLFMDSTALLQVPDTAITIDLLLLSHNPRIDIADLLHSVRPAVIVFDASNSMWKIQKWKRDCDALNLRCHSVPEDGAFVLNVNGP